MSASSLASSDHTVVPMPAVEAAPTSCCDRAEKVVKTVFGVITLLTGLGMDATCIAIKESAAAAWEAPVVGTIGGIMTLAGIYILVTNPFSRMEKELAAAKAETNLLTKQVTDLTAQTNDVKVDEDKLDTVVTHVETATTEIVGELGQVHDNLSADLQVEQSLNDQLDTMAGNIKGLLSQSEDGKKAIAASAKKANRLAQKLMEQQDRELSANQKLLVKLKEITANSNALQTLVSTLTTEVTDLGNLNATMQTQLAELQAQVASEQGLLSQEGTVTTDVNALIAGLKEQNDRLAQTSAKK
jgi:chromosome segregation ATPase